jgi:hypothetical protein
MIFVRDGRVFNRELVLDDADQCPRVISLDLARAARRRGVDGPGRESTRLSTADSAVLLVERDVAAPCTITWP